MLKKKIASTQFLSLSFKKKENEYKSDNAYVKKQIKWYHTWFNFTAA
jgi:hypothetical protein